MAKANFSKVEKALEEELIRMTSERLLEETPSSKIHKGEKLPAPQDQVTILKNMERLIKKISKKDPGLMQKGGIDLESFNTLLECAGKLSKEQWQSAKEIQKKLSELKKALTDQTAVSDEALVEEERKKHINKRFNVQEKWLPLQ
jgi:hypothetical protein